MQYTGGGGGQVANQYKELGRRQGEAEEEWVTKKKVEITTTKNVERKIQRQLVLEDGRVVEDEIPTVTNDTTEDKQTFETDHDEDRKVEEGTGIDLIQSKFNSKGGLLVGDKFTSVKRIQDVKENLVKTEAVQNMGDIRSKDLKKVLKEKDDIRKYLRNSDNSKALIAPRTVISKKNHRVVTDKEDIQERNWLHDGKMQNERVKTEEHIEYDSDDTPDSGSSSSKSSIHKLDPEVYKTRKDENFVEYFKIDRADGKEKLVKVGDGVHYVSESKDMELQEDKGFLVHTSSPRLTLDPAKQEKKSKKQITHTDSWLERHFGSSSSSLSASSVDLSRPSGGLRRSASICDIRPVTDSSSNVYYATVRKTAKVPVPRREKKEDYYHENRRSAHFTSSGHPVRPPRRKKNTDSESSNYMSQSQIYGGSYRNNQDEIYSNTNNKKPTEYIYGTLKRDQPSGEYTFSRQDDYESNLKSSSNRRHDNNDSQQRISNNNAYNNNSSSSEYRNNTDSSHYRSSESLLRNNNSNNISNSSTLHNSGSNRVSRHPDREQLENEKNRLKSRTVNTDKYYFSQSGSRNNRSSNSRSYSPAPQKMTRGSSKSHHQSTGNLYTQTLDRSTRGSKSHHQSTGNIYSQYNREKSDLSQSRNSAGQPQPRPGSAAATNRRRELYSSSQSLANNGSSQTLSRNHRHTEIYAQPSNTRVNRDVSRDINITRENSNLSRDTNINREKDINISRDRDINISRNRDININRDRDINFSRDRDINISRERDVNSNRDKVDNNIAREIKIQREYKATSRDNSSRDQVDRSRRDAYGNNRDVYRSRDTSRDMYKGGEREVYGSREISREIYASPQQHSRDVYASPSHRIVYSTESPKGSPSTKYRTKIVLNGGIA